MPTWSANHAFRNKEPLEPRQVAFGKPFNQITDSLSALGLHISQGGAWCPNIFEKGIRKRGNFVSSEFLALDLDHGPQFEVIIANPFIRDYACIIYPTASSTPENPRYRVIFHVSEKIDSVNRWEQLQQALIRALFPLQPDTACKDAGRMYFGSDLPGHYLNEQAILPIEIAGALTLPQALAEDQRLSQQQYKQKLRQNRRSGRREVSETLVYDLENRLGVHQTRCSDSGFTIGAVACPMRSHEHDAEHPAAHWHHDKKILRCHKCGRSFLAHEVAEALGLKLSDYYPKIVPPIIKCSHEYMTNYDLPKLIQQGNRTLLIKSPTGTGKTELMKQIVRSKPDARVLVIMHRRSLVDDVCKRFNKDSDLAFQSYEKLNDAELRSAPRLCICINSLEKLFPFDQIPPHYDLVIMDEIEQQFTHLVGNTFKANQAVNTHQILRSILQDCNVAIGLDAYATRLSFEWLTSLRGEEGAKWIINTYEHRKKDMILLNTPQDVIAEADRQMLTSDVPGPIVFAVTSIRTGKLLYSYYSGEALAASSTAEEDDENIEDALLKLLEASPFRLGRDQVVLVCGDTTDTQEIRDFLNNLAERLPKIKVLIYTSALGTGFDIQPSVKGVFGVFRAGILTADELHQMLARCRNTQGVWVNIKAGGGGRETTAHRLYDREIRNMQTTGTLLRNITPGQPVSLNPVLESYLRFQSRVQSKMNHSHNRLRRAFHKLAIPKYRIQHQMEDYNDELLLDISNKLVIIQRKNATIDKSMTLRSTPVDLETYQHLQHAHKLTNDVIAGHFRWGIEQGYRQTITAAIYDHAIKGGMAHLINFTHLCSPDSDLIMQDAYQALAEYAPHQRNHVTSRKRLTFMALKAVWGDFKALEDLGAIRPEEIEVQMKTLPPSFSTQVKHTFRWHHNVVTQPVNMLRRLLREIGLEFKKGRSGQLKGYYQIDPETLATMRRYSEHRMNAPDPAKQPPPAMQKSA